MDIRTEIPDELHRALKVRAAEMGLTLRELIVLLLTEALEATVSA